MNELSSDSESTGSPFELYGRRSPLRRVDRDVNVLLLGSAPEAEVIRDAGLSGVVRVAINNSWRIREDMDYIVFPNNFPEENRPPASKGIEPVWETSYLKRVAASGGLLFTGSTMALNAAYWAVRALRATIVGFFASDMIYSGRSTHFYGKGEADPLRENITLRSLEAKSIRLFAFGLATGTVIVNFSMQPVSRLALPRMPLGSLVRRSGLQGFQSKMRSERRAALVALHESPLAAELVTAAHEIVKREEAPPFSVDPNDYWSLVGDEDAIAFLDEINQAWLDLAPLVSEVSRPLYGLSALK